MSEGHLSSCLTDLLNAHMYRSEKRDRLVNFLQFFEQAGNRYLDSRISRSLQPLLDAASRLCEFTAQHFFLHSNPGLDVFSLYPEHRGGPPGTERAQHYERHAAELEKTLEPLEELYQKYRRVVKNQLLVSCI